MTSGAAAVRAFSLPVVQSHMEQLERVRRMVRSRMFFEKCKFAVEVHVRNGTTTRVEPLGFPDACACFADAEDRSGEEEVDAQFYIDNPKYVITKLDHLPHYRDVCATADEFKKIKEYENLPSDLDDADRVYARPQVLAPPSEGQTRSIIVEAEAKKPVPFENKTRFVVCVRGCSGTDQTRYMSDEFTGESLVHEMHEHMALRKSALAMIRKVVARAGEGAENRIHPHPVLYSRFCFAYTANGDLGGQVLSGEDVDVPLGKCGLATFRVVWVDQGKKRSLALASVIVAFVFTRPAKEEANKEDGDAECVVCFEDVDKKDAHTCPRCCKSIHLACHEAWSASCCLANGPVTCPFCRHVQ